MNKSIMTSDEAWDSGELGRDEDHVAALSLEDCAAIDDSAGMQMISIRLPKDMIAAYKLIAQLNGVGYQPLMRDILSRFVDGEMHNIAMQALEQRQAELEKMQAETEQNQDRKCA